MASNVTSVTTNLSFSFSHAPLLANLVSSGDIYSTQHHLDQLNFINMGQLQGGSFTTVCNETLPTERSIVIGAFFQN